MFNYGLLCAHKHIEIMNDMYHVDIGSVVFKALCYKPEDRGFDTR
jgi:hypothetical protein